MMTAQLMDFDEVTGWKCINVCDNAVRGSSFFQLPCLYRRRSLFMCAPLSYDFFPAFQAVRCQVLDYFFRQRECLRDDHVLFSFEQSMLFSRAEFDLINQASFHTYSYCFFCETVLRSEMNVIFHARFLRFHAL